MNGRCAEGCEILKGHAFCGKHGLKAEEAENAELRKACTAACGRDDLLKADTFCGGCGSKQEGDTEEYDQLLKSLGQYADARASLIDADLGTFAAVDDDAIAAGTAGGEMLKSLPANVEAGEVTIDSMPLVAALLKAVNKQSVTSESHSLHLLKAVVQIGERMGERSALLLKANHALAIKVAALETQVEELGGAPRSPGKATQVAGTMLKSVPGAQGRQAAARKDLHGPALLLKASALAADQGGLTSREIEPLRGITDQGGGIPELIAVGQHALAHRVEEILARVNN